MGYLMQAGGRKKGRLWPSAPPTARQSVDASALADLDTQLMLALRAGDTSAGNTLVRRNFERVAGYLGRLIRDPVPVEDLAQEVFLQVFKSAPRYEPTARFSTWLYRIATNAARNYLTRSGRRQQRRFGSVEPGARAGPDRRIEPAQTRSDATPDQHLSLDEMRARVAAALGSLPVNQRIALTLFEFEGLSYEQIAAILEVSVDAVRGLLKRAREGLRPLLRELL
jgi:RNA polymerase sigma-70 factor (ECF subfamily)